MAKKEKTAAEEQETKVAEEPEQTTETPSETEELEAKLSQAEEKFLRLAAEYDNYRKRTDKEKKELNGVCIASVIEKILPVVDNLDRALDSKTDNLEEYKKGVEMIGKQFYDVMTALKVESFGEVGDTFDPNLHNAVMHIEDENLGENVLSAVFSKGYRLGEKVIRPAMVQVAN